MRILARFESINHYFGSDTYFHTFISMTRFFLTIERLIGYEYSSTISVLTIDFLLDAVDSNIHLDQLIHYNALEYVCSLLYFILFKSIEKRWTQISSVIKLELSQFIHVDIVLISTSFNGQFLNKFLTAYGIFVVPHFIVIDDWIWKQTACTIFTLSVFYRCR